MKDNLIWETIYYNEERDTDGTLLSHEWTEAADYLDGTIIRMVHIDENDKRTESITFCKD